MKLVRWSRFSWDLVKLPAPDRALETYYRVRPAATDEEKTVRDVVFSAFALDSAWADTLKSIQEWLENQIAEAFSHDGVPSLVITHGARIIGATVLDANPEAESHLLTGPCVLSEYRNRGLGSALLHESLLALHGTGLTSVCGITKDNVPAAKFVYPKFHSTHESIEFEPLLVGS